MRKWRLSAEIHETFLLLTVKSMRKSQVSKLKLPVFVFTALNYNSSGPTAFLQDLNSDLKVKENRLMLSLKTPTMYISLRMHPLFIAPCLAINLPPSLKCSLFLIINFPLLAFNKQNWNVMNKTLPGTDNYSEKKICFITVAYVRSRHKKNDIYVLKYIIIMFLSTYINGMSHVYFKS